MVALQLFFTYTPHMNTLFQSSPIVWDSWWRILCVAIVAYAAAGLHKMISNRTA